MWGRGTPRAHCTPNAVGQRGGGSMSAVSAQRWLWQVAKERTMILRKMKTMPNSKEIQSRPQVVRNRLYSLEKHFGNICLLSYDLSFLNEETMSILLTGVHGT